MKLNEIYFEVEKLIKKVDFNNLWPGFKPFKFALYNETECFFDGEYVDRTDEFLANTAINYNGEMIAIWNMIEEINPIILCSKIIHEMFHGYQKINKESRFPDEIEAIINYNYDEENLSYKLLENELIVELLEEFSVEKFNKMLGLMKYRYDNYNYEFMYEKKIEQVEGSACFVELNVLKQLSIDIYLKELNKIKSEIVNSNNLLPVRIISYNIGALLLIILHENNISFNTEFNEETYIEQLVKNSNIYTTTINDKVVKSIKSFNEKSISIINNAIKINDVILDQETKLLGFNVYNGRYYNGYIISYYFVMFEDRNCRIRIGDFVIKLSENGNISKIYKF